MLPVLMTSQIEERTDNLIEQIKEDCNSNQQEQLLEQLGNYLSGWEIVENISIMNQAKILYTVYQLWEQTMCIRNEAKSKWDGDFYLWAKKYTKRRSIEPSKTTIDNKITVFRDYVALELIEAPQTIYVPNRDSGGNIISDNEEDWHVVDGDFMKADYTKLLTARGSAKRGELTPEAWTGLFDPYCTVNQLSTIINKPKKRNSQNNSNNNDTTLDDFRLYEKDGIVYAYEDKEQIELAHLLVENTNNPLWQRGVNHLLSSVKVHTPLAYKNDFKTF